MKEFTLVEVFDAPRQAVWDSWTDPEQLARWWGPHGFTTPASTIEVDLRPGGTFRLTMLDADGVPYPSVMEFREVVPPERLVFAWSEQPGHGSGCVTVTFRDLGGRTEMTCHLAARTDADAGAEAQAGWREQFARLAASLT